MASTYVNNLRLNEMATGDGAGTWGTTTNLNLELIGQALGWGTRAIANASTDNITIADGASDADRSMALKLTGGGQACTVTILPNTSSKVWIMENATAATLTFTQGSGANVAILAGETKIIATDGGGSSAVVYDLLTDVNLAGTTKTAVLTNAGLLTTATLTNQGLLTNQGDADFSDDVTLKSDSAVLGFGADTDTTLTHTDGSGLTLNSTNKIMFNDETQFIHATNATTLNLAATDEIQLDATAIDINGTADISGTLTNATAAVKVAGLETIYVPAGAMYPTTTNGCSDLTQVELSNGPELSVLDFAADADDFAQFSVIFPKSWNEGTVTFQAFFTVTGTNTGTVAWGLSGVSIADNVSNNTAFGTNVVAAAKSHSGTTNDLDVSAVSGDVTIASAAADTFTYFQIMRDVSADSQTGTARLQGIKLFFTTDAKNDSQGALDDWFWL